MGGNSEGEKIIVLESCIIINREIIKAQKQTIANRKKTGRQLMMQLCLQRTL